MKKSMIAAGAASVALAAMPIVGAFAAPSAPVMSQTDTLMINIESACSIGYDSDASDAGGSTIEVEGVDHTDGSGAWGDGTGTPTPGPGDLGHPDTLAATMLNGTTSNNLGTTTLGIYCNDPDGYSITTTGAGSLSDAASPVTTSAVIPVNSAFSATSTGWSYQVAAGSATTQRGEVKNSHAGWATDSTTTSPMANEVIAGSPASGTKTTSNAGDFFTITYGAGINDSLPAATYKGSITYTLTAL